MQRINFVFNILRLSMFAISVVISGFLYTKIRNYNKNEFNDLHHFCYAAKGDMFPHQMFKLRVDNLYSVILSLYNESASNSTDIFEREQQRIDVKNEYKLEGFDKERG